MMMMYFCKMKKLMHNLRVLKRLKKLSIKQRKRYVSCCNKQFINCVSEVSHNLLKGNVKLTARQLDCLRRYKRVLREMSKKRNGLKKRHKIITQNGGFISAILGPAIGAIASLIGGLINNRN